MTHLLTALLLFIWVGSVCGLLVMAWWNGDLTR